MSKYTVFGGSGFIGTEIVRQLTELGHEVFIPRRNDKDVFKRDLGIVIYCSGNGDCQNSPFDVLDANVILLKNILLLGQFTRLVYLSSTRLYMGNQCSEESSDLIISPLDNRRLFNLTKLVSEELCLKSRRDVVVVRPSNVYGVALNSPLFLPSITRNAIKNGKIDMYIPKDYAKDYVSVNDVASSCIALSKHTDVSDRIVNVASGYNTMASDIADVLIKHTNCEVVWHQLDNNFIENFPKTNIDKLKALLCDYKPKNVLSDLKLMITDYKTQMYV